MIVADTHVIIWDALKPELLSKKAKRAISSANKDGGIIFCEISLWEIAMLMEKGRLTVDCSFIDFIKLVFESNNYFYRGITPEIAGLSTQIFNDSNKDPADRIIAATSIIENAKLITADKYLQNAKNISTTW